MCLYTPAGYQHYFRQVHTAVAARAEVGDVLLSEFRSRFHPRRIASIGPIRMWS